jgi:hypothetical protein
MLVGDSNKKNYWDTHLAFISFSNIEIELSHVIETGAKPQLYRKPVQSGYAIYH